MYYFVIILYAVCALALIWLGYSFQTERFGIRISATAPVDDRTYWQSMNKKIAKGFFIGAAGSVIVSVTVAFRMMLAAEIGCITLLAAMVFTLAILCKKTDFRPCEETEKLQKRWKTILLIAAFGALLLTQFVFQYFNSLRI